MATQAMDFYEEDQSDDEELAAALPPVDVAAQWLPVVATLKASCAAVCALQR